MAESESFITCDHTLPPFYSEAVKEGMIHLLVGSYVKKTDSVFFSDWSRNNAYETLRSYWLSYFNLISGQKVGLEENRMAETERDFSEDEFSAASVEALRNFHYDFLKVEQIECLQWVVICLREDIFAVLPTGFGKGVGVFEK